MHISGLGCFVPLLVFNCQLIFLGIDVVSGGSIVSGTGNDSSMLSLRFVFNLEGPSSFQKTGRFSY